MHAIATGLLLLSILGGVHLAAQEPARQGRVVVIGFDGLDYERCKRLMEEGQLPHLKALSESGALRPLVPPTPAQSPVAWSSMVTGFNPGRTGIDDFLGRDFAGGDVRPELSLVDRGVDRSGFLALANRRMASAAALVLSAALLAFGWRRRRLGFKVAGGFAVLVTGLLIAASEMWLPDGRPYPINVRGEKTYWEVLDGHGVDTCTLFAPCSFPAPHLSRGTLLAGLGVPDVAASPGFWTVLDERAHEIRVTETGGRVLPVYELDPSSKDGRFSIVEIEGPPDIVRADGSRVSAPLATIVDREAGSVHLRSILSRHTVLRGRWSEPFRVLFRTNPLVNLVGRARFKVLDVKDHVRVYIEPLGFDPAYMPPGIRISHPNTYAYELESAVGAFETLGWACATNALKDGQIDERTFLEDAQRVFDEEERLFLHELARRSSGVITGVFSPTDRIQHMFLRYDDPERAASAEPIFRTAVDDAYRRADALVGHVRDVYLRADDVLFVVSDHGFAPFKRAVNLNSLLIEKGLQVLKDRTGGRTLAAHLGTSDAFSHVDWNRTKAYALGLGKIYLNRAGREPMGIVTDGDANQVMAAIEAALGGLRDEGEAVVARVDRGSDVYDGSAIKNGAADLYVSFKAGYRVSWHNCLGGSDEPVIADNGNAWSGDHCGVDPDAVRGVFFSSMPLADDDVVRAVDVAPTILALFGVGLTAPGAKDGRSRLR